MSMIVSISNKKRRKFSVARARRRKYIRKTIHNVNNLKSHAMNCNPSITSQTMARMLQRKTETTSTLPVRVFPLVKLSAHS